jgi:hypothetical protein
LQRDNLQQKEDYDLLLDEDKEKIHLAMKVCEEAIGLKK